MTNYRDLTKTEAAAALQEFLDERGPALARLRDYLAADGQDPAALLDGTPESFVPLWRWMLSRLTGPEAPGAPDPASVPREAWPSWERYTVEEEGVLSLESLTLMDGLVSYLAAVVLDRAPLARWEIARDRHKRYQFNNHPVLVGGTGESHNFLPGFPMVQACGVLLGVRESPDDTIAVYARELIEQLNEGDGGTAEATPAEPPSGSKTSATNRAATTSRSVWATRSPTNGRPTSTGLFASCPARAASTRSSGRTGN